MRKNFKRKFIFVATRNKKNKNLDPEVEMMNLACRVTIDVAKNVNFDLWAKSRFLAYRRDEQKCMMHAMYHARRFFS